MVIRRYSWSGVPAEDLSSEATAAVLRAVERYDPEAGPFSAFVLFPIREAVHNAARAAWSPASIPTGRKERRLHTQGSRLYHELVEAGASPDAAIDLVAEEMELEPSHVRAAVALHQRVDRSLDAGESDWLGMHLADGGEPGREAEEDDMARIVLQVLAELPARERQILKRRFLGERQDTYDAIGADLGISRKRVRSLRDRAIGRFRRILESRGLSLGDPV